MSASLHPCCSIVLLVGALAGTTSASGTFPPPPPGATLVSAVFTSPSAVVIPDLGAGNSPIEVSGLTGKVWDVNVVTNISHTSTVDLHVVLIAPSGKEVVLASGVNRSLFALTLDDDYTTPVSSNVGQLCAPEMGFAALDGEDPNGTWTVRCRDFLLGDSGLFTWQLEIATIDLEPVRHVTSHFGEAVVGLPPFLDTTLDVAATGFVCDVDVVLHISYPAPNQLSMSLYSPGDARSCFLNDSRGTVATFYANASFDDDSTDLARFADDNVPLGEVSPITSLGVFRGVEASGTWRLSIGSIGSDPITVLGWELRITTCAAPAPETFCFGTAPAPCPCGNNGALGRGCANAAHAGGAELTAIVPGGAAHVADDVVLQASDIDPFQIVLFVQGTEGLNGGVGAPLGDGLLCATGQVVRLAARYSGFGSTSYPGLFDLPLSRRGGLPPAGGTRVYQALYRSPLLFGPCHTGMNSTNALRLTWLPQTVPL